MRLEIPAPGRRTLSGHARPPTPRVDAVNHTQDQRERGADRAGAGRRLDARHDRHAAVRVRDPRRRQGPGIVNSQAVGHWASDAAGFCLEAEE
jgi:hypothetical protein